MADMVYSRTLISGSVQGVGFRYFVTSRAERYGITGFVRNLDTGGVELEVEGDKKDVYDFLMEIKRGPTHAEIVAFQTEWRTYQKKYDTFFVKY
ncbi:MAG: acylphosphatase [candidate division Zixibacteria bacterium]|nr:acylphosphatase [candidate division Zixibacteria bacterium]